MIFHYPWRLALGADEVSVELPWPKEGYISPEVGAFCVNEASGEVGELPGPTKQSGAGQVRHEEDGEAVLYSEDAHQYQACSTESACRKFHYAVTDLFIQLADFLYQEHREKNGDRLGDLPIGEVCGKLEAYLGSEKDFAPETLIVRIARGTTRALKNIVESPRVVLKREHQQVPLERMQEVDGVALQDYARRPGRTAAMKAGRRQRLLAVVREESADTYENRVVRAFIVLSMRAARQYKEDMCSRCPRRGECKTKDPQREGTECPSERVKKVHSFSLFCQMLLSSGTMQKVAYLVEPVTKPNYVLQQNPRYASIWKFYLKLLRQEDVEGNVWRWKRRTWADAMRVFMMYFWNRRLSKMAGFQIQTSRKPFMIKEDDCRGTWLCSDPFEDAAVFSVGGGDDYATVYLLNSRDAERLLEEVEIAKLNADFYWVVKSAKSKFRTYVIPVWCMCADAAWEEGVDEKAKAACQETQKILDRLEREFVECDFSRSFIFLPGEEFRVSATRDRHYFCQVNLFRPEDVKKFFDKVESVLERVINHE